VSLSVSPSEQQALYNSIEGLTSLWDLQSGEIVGQYASYVRSGPASGEPGNLPDHTAFEVCVYHSFFIFSLVSFSKPKRRELRCYRWVR
jgi:hypothetical protein